MDTIKSDIFVGSYVQVSLNRDTSSDTPGFFDPGYLRTMNLAGFPSISVKPEVRAFEDYREDFTRKLSGDIKVEDTNLVVMSVPNDPFQEELDKALMEKRPLRFRNLYVIDTDNGESGQAGMYHIFDAVVVKKTTSGTADSVVLDTYLLSPTGQLFQGFAQIGEVLREGDYGVGGGTEKIPGVFDLGSLNGNRWVTVDAANSQNPFGSDTSAMAIQHPNGVGWELIGTSMNAPALRIRNKKIQGDTVQSSTWIKVYTESEPPTATDVKALPIKGGTITGNLIVEGTTTSRGKLMAETSELLNIKSTDINTKTLTAEKITLAELLVDIIKTKDIQSPKGRIDNLVSTKIVSGTAEIDSLVSTDIVSINVQADHFKGGDFSGTSITGTEIKGTSVKVNNKEVYHPGNKPSAADVGAVPIGAVIDFGYF